MRSITRCFWSQSLVKRLIVLLLALFLAGCGGEEPSSDDTTSASAPGAAPGSAGSPAGASGSPPAEAKAVAGTGAVAKQVSTASRKIIYTAEIALIAENLSEAQKKLVDLVARHKGYIASTNIDGSSGAPRSGTWKVRIPVDDYDAFMSGAVRIGEVQTVHSDSQDVSDEFFDLEARLSNKRIEEKRLLEHLQKSTGKLSEILTVEKEISRVREEIERMEGRLRVLANQTSLTTVTITIQEIKDYTPPVPPAFGTQIGRTFNTSLKAMLDLGKGFTLLATALVPWLVLLLIIAVPLRIFTRRAGVWPRRKDKDNGDTG